MPELPEVETTVNGIKPYLVGQKVTAVIVRTPRLRFPIPPSLSANIIGQTLKQIDRRGKYILLHFPNGILITHYSWMHSQGCNLYQIRSVSTSTSGKSAMFSQHLLISCCHDKLP